MKAILKFDLPEEQHEFDLATCAVNLHMAIDEIDNRLRVMYKYENKETFDTYDFRNEVREILFSHNVNLDDVKHVRIKRSFLKRLKNKFAFRF